MSRFDDIDRVGEPSQPLPSVTILIQCVVLRLHDVRSASTLAIDFPGDVKGDESAAKRMINCQLDSAWSHRFSILPGNCPKNNLLDSVIFVLYNTVMKNASDVRWTIEQLREVVARALEGKGYDGPPNGRVRDVPDQRTIRYYTTLGLIDRASEMRGRTALYGTRHLLQLVAIKKLQAKGQTLAEVQRALAGQTDAALARLAGLSTHEWATATKPAKSARREFWKQAPTAAPEIEEIEAVEPEVDDRHPQTLQGVPLAENVTLLLASSRPITGEDFEAVRSVSRPLIDLLVKLDILTPRGERGSR
jgi:DNA-binding transcriptional MerR regulator